MTPQGQGRVVWGHSHGAGVTEELQQPWFNPLTSAHSNAKQVPLYQGLCVAPVCSQPASLATTPQEGHLPQRWGTQGTCPRSPSSQSETHLGN